jgi:RNA polymerase sporulation-specific sigma factor
VGLTDVELVARARSGDGRSVDALLRRYESLLRLWAAEFFLPGGGEDDLRQEARLGLLAAIGGYDSARGSFSGFARLCARRKLMTAVKLANGGRALALTDSRRVAIDDENEPVDSVDLLAAWHTDPAEIIFEREQIRALVQSIKRLSPLERRALVGVCFEGIEHRDLGEPKQVDNARQRATRKLRAAA